MISRIVRLSVLVVAVLFLIAAIAQAQLPLPMQVKGRVLVNGENLPDGTVIRAWCGGLEAGSGLTQIASGESLYQIPVRADDPSQGGRDGCFSGDEVSFTIDDDQLPADQTTSFVVGGRATVNLTAFRPLPSLDLEKYLNGQDVAGPPGPFILTGQAVNWSYVVTNTGNVSLTNVIVTDDQEPGLSCTAATLVVDDSLSCATSGTAAYGLYSNLATATGLFASTVYPSVTVSDTDRSYYYSSSTQYVTITACKVEDKDGDASTEADQEPLAGWDVYLSVGGVRQEPGKKTAANGCATWQNLAPLLNYGVEEDLPSGWTALTPTEHDFGASLLGGNYQHTFVNYNRYLIYLPMVIRNASGG
jgi:uncharacterized repeat protein (TIGR01451 family)